MLSPKLSLALALGAIFFFIEAPLLVTSEGETGGGAATGPVKIGPLFQCDHDVRGMVYAIHEKKLMITGFEYDGQGPSTWFNGMLKGATGMHHVSSSFFIIILIKRGLFLFLVELNYIHACIFFCSSHKY